MIINSNLQSILTSRLLNYRSTSTDDCEKFFNNSNQHLNLSVAARSAKMHDCGLNLVDFGLSTKAFDASRLVEKDIVKPNSAFSSSTMIKTDSSLRKQLIMFAEKQISPPVKAFQLLLPKCISDIKQNAQKVKLPVIEPSCYLNKTEKNNIDNFLLNSNFIDNEPFSNNFNKKVGYAFTQSQNKNSNHFTEYKKNIFVENQANNKLSNQESSNVLPMLADKDCLFYNREACSKTLDNHNTLNDHCDGSYCTKSFQCEICNKSFSYKSQLRQHFECHSELRSFQCAICNKSFKRKRQVKQHFVCHSELRPFQCAICNQSFKHKRQLKQHIECHSELRPFKCTMCNKSFKRMTYLKEHYKTHSKEKKFKCNLCDKRFRLASTLRAHLKTHTDERPFRCDICSKRYKSSYQLKRHLKTTHLKEKSVPPAN